METQIIEATNNYINYKISMDVIGIIIVIITLYGYGQRSNHNFCDWGCVL
jgi:hypothetical protein